MTGPSLSIFGEQLSILCEFFWFVGGFSRLKIVVKRPFFTNVAPYEVYALSLHAPSAAVCRVVTAVVAIHAF